MNLARLILLALQVSVFLTVFALGLNARFTDALSLWRHPGALVRSLTAMFVIMPIFAVMITRLFTLDPAVEVALLVLSVSPVPPILPSKGAKLGAHGAYVFGLLVEMALLSMLITPFAITVLGRIFGRETHVAPAAIAVVILKTILVPLVLGMAFGRLWPAVASRLSEVLRVVCAVVLFAGAVLLLVGARHQIGEVVGNGTLVALTAFCVVGLAVGQWLGGHDREDSSFLAIATASRHPGVAFTVASGIVSDTKMVIAAVLVYLLVSALVSAPYSRWRKGGSPATPAVHPLSHGPKAIGRRGGL